MNDQIEWDSLIEFLISFFRTSGMIESTTVLENSCQEKMLKKAILCELVTEVSRQSPYSNNKYCDYVLLPKGKQEIEKYKNKLGRKCRGKLHADTRCN